MLKTIRHIKLLYSDSMFLNRSTKILLANPLLYLYSVCCKLIQYELELHLILMGSRSQPVFSILVDHSDSDNTVLHHTDIPLPAFI